MNTRIELAIGAAFASELRDRARRTRHRADGCDHFDERLRLLNQARSLDSSADKAERAG